MIYLRVYAQDMARNRHLVATQRFGDWGSALLWLTGQASKHELTVFPRGEGVVYEIEEYAGTPGDPDGE